MLDVSHNGGSRDKYGQSNKATAYLGPPRFSDFCAVPRYQFSHLRVNLSRSPERGVVREGRCRRGRRIVRAAWRVPIPLFSTPRQAADNINVEREGVGADAWKGRGVDICASELIPPPCACMGAHGSALHVHVRARDEGTGTEKGWGQKGMEEAGDDRSLEPHGWDNTFWRYKNECFSHPYLRGDSAKPRTAKARKGEKERERDKKEGESSPSSSLFSRRRKGGFSTPRGKRGKCLVLDGALFWTSSRTWFFDVFLNGDESEERGERMSYNASTISRRSSLNYSV